jgi:cathepsin B
MKILLILAVAAASTQPDWKAIVASVNNDPTSTWQAAMPSERDLFRVHDLAGGYIPFSKDRKLPEFKNDYDPSFVAPESYDARTAFPQCYTISHIRDQCACGSCFAFGALEAFEDRICIHLKQNVTLSAEDIISCHDDGTF